MFLECKLRPSENSINRIGVLHGDSKFWSRVDIDQGRTYVCLLPLIPHGGGNLPYSLSLPTAFTLETFTHPTFGNSYRILTPNWEAPNAIPTLPSLKHLQTPKLKEGNMNVSHWLWINSMQNQLPTITTTKDLSGAIGDTGCQPSPHMRFGESWEWSTQNTLLST